MNKDKLYSRWLRLMFNLGITDPMDNQFEELWVIYNGSDRKYHNIDHIYYVLGIYDTVVHLLEEPILVELALWYHDAYMDFTRAMENEWLSVKFFFGHFEGHLDTQQKNRVSQFIMATKISEDVYWLSDEDYMSDIDMAAFADSKVVEENSRKIREEYKNVPDEVFYENRSIFLKSLINNGVFRSPFIKGQLEEDAMRHISSEIRAIHNRGLQNENTSRVCQ